MVGVDALQLESAAPVVVVGTGDAVVVVVVGVGDVARKNPLVVVILEKVDADYVAVFVIVEGVDEVINFAARIGYGMVGFQQVVGVVVELHLIDSVVGIETVEEIILRYGCAAREQGEDDQEEVFEGFHDVCVVR